MPATVRYFNRTQTIIPGPVSSDISTCSALPLTPQTSSAAPELQLQGSISEKIDENVLKSRVVDLLYLFLVPG